MNPGSDMPCGAASSLTPSEPPASESRMPRRVESASAANTVSRSSSEYLTIRFSIQPSYYFVKIAFSISEAS